MKLALATSAVYIASSLIIPAFANNVDKPIQAEPVEQVITAEQAKYNYEFKFAEYAKDLSLISPEIEDLDRLLGQYMELKDKEGVNIKPSETKKITKSDSLDLIIKEFKQGVIPFYPGLISKELKYDAFRPVKEGQDLKPLIERAYKITNDQVLEALLNKEAYEVKDIVIFNERLNIHKLPKKIENKEVYNPIEESVQKIDLSDAKLRFVKSAYESYLEARDKEFAHAKRYWNAGIEGAAIEDEAHLGVGKGFFKEEMLGQLDEALSLQDYGHLTVSRFYKGAGFKGKIPWIPSWATMFLAMGFTFLRNALILGVVKRNWDALDTMDGVLGIFSGFCFDFIHPLIFPIRAFAVPFVMEPMRKIFDLYDIT